MNAVDALRASSIFNDLDDETLARLAPHLERRSVRGGEVVTREGEPADTFFVLTEGRVKVSKAGVGTAAADLLELAAPAHFGEIGILLEGPRTATVTAAVDCELYALSTLAADQALVESPEAAARFFRALAISLAQRLKATTDEFTSQRLR